MADDIVMAGIDPGIPSDGQLTSRAPHSDATLDGEIEHGEDRSDVEDADEEEDMDEDEDEGGEVSIKTGLKSAFYACESGFKGTYATWQKYPSAPNPCMEVDGLGLLGLPLSSAEAARLRSRCNPAAFGKGERTVIDPNVRDTFELDGGHIRFLNPLWDSWLETAVLKACDQLGVTGKQVRYELYKLLLYETGSHFQMHQDTEKSPGMFATVVIVLPSPHEGGVVRVKHGRQEKLLDSGSEGIATTSVLSWYTDVHHEVKAVTKGFRLALAFNLVYSGDAQAVPRAPASDDVFQQMDDALAAWQAKERAGESCPQRLIHVLSHHYSQANVSFGHLKGVDSTLVNLLREVAESRGFCVALGHLDYSVSGSADDCGGYNSHNVSMAEVESRNLSLQLISGSTGVNIGRKIAIEGRYDGDSDDGAEPEDEDDEVELLVDKEFWENERPDDQDYEGYQGNYAGSLELFYHRTVVVFWPRSKNTSIIASVGGRDVAIADLKKCTSLRPTATDIDNVALALTAGESQVACIVTDLALRWQDVEMWHDALKSCKGECDVHSLGMQRIRDALVLFKFSRLRPVLDAIVSKTMSTLQRLQFIEALEAYTESNTGEFLVPRDWIMDKRRYVLSSLRTPKLEDVDPIISVLTTLPDARTLFCDTVLPQLRALNMTSDWWMALTTRLRASPNTDTSLPNWESPVFEVAKLTFTKAIHLAPSNESRFLLLIELEGAWASHKDATSWIHQSRRWAIDHLTRPTADDLNLIMNLVRTEDGFFSSTLIPALRGMDYVDEFWPDLFTRLDQYSREDGNTLPGSWSNVFAETLRIPLTKAQLQATSNPQFFTILERIALAAPQHESVNLVVQEHTRAALRKLKRPTIDEIPLLINKLKHDIECGSTLFVPQLEAYGLELAFWESIVSKTCKQSNEFYQAGWSREQLHALLGALASRAIASTAFPFPFPPPQTQYNWHMRTALPVNDGPVNDVKRLLVLCLRAQHAHLATRIFRKVFTTYTTADVIKSVIVPLVPAILSILQGNRTAADTQPFDQFFRETMRSFITVIVGRKPDDKDVANWAGNLRSSCKCGDCSYINSAIASQKQVVWLASQTRRYHIESQFRSMRELRMSTRQGGRGRMSELIITKLVDELGPVALWSKRSAEAMQLLRSIGPDALIHSIYAPTSDQLKIVIDCLKGTALPSALSAAPFMTDVPSGSSGANDAPVASSSTAAAGAPSASTIPKKRKAPPVDSADVIEISD